MFYIFFKSKNPFFLFFFASFLLLACGGDEDEKDPIPDVSNIAVNIKIDRFEQDLFAIDTNNLAVGVQALQKKYPLMCDIFTSGIINDQRFSSSEATLGGFIRSPQVRQLYDTVQQVYPNLMNLEKDFTQAFKYYKYYFPKKNVPQVVSYISEYTFGTFPYKDSLVGIGLDFFLGAKHTGYAFAEIPTYIARSFDETHLVAKCMEGVATDLVDAPMGNRLLDVMIHNGKKLYILDKFLPNAPDSIKLDYTQLQVEWCKANESEVWAHLLTEKLLYSSKQSDWTKLVNPSPVGTTKMPVQSPGRVGNWMGYRILKAYMKRHPNTSLEQLLVLKDAQKILDESKYKPKRK